MPGLVSQLLDQTAQPVLQRAVSFSAARHALLTQNVANATTPGYVQQDLSEAAFNKTLSRHVDRRRTTGRWESAEDRLDLSDEAGGILYHDKNNRSMEQLMAASAKNALRHNALVELMRREFDQIDAAIREGR